MLNGGVLLLSCITKFGSLYTIVTMVTAVTMVTIVTVCTDCDLDTQVLDNNLCQVDCCNRMFNC